MLRRALPLMSLLFALSPAVMADELSDGVKAWQRQDYRQAQAVFSKLAAAGDAEAQRQLGEMYAFGEGVPEDMAKADQWLQRAQAGGSKDAAASLQTVHRRAARKADIAFYVSKYDGAELSLSQHGCVQPGFPKRSETRAEMKEISAAMTAWQACYQRFAKDLVAAMPAGKAIPEDLAGIMNKSEFAAARARMEQVYTAMAADAKRQATALIAANDTWVQETERYARGDNAALNYALDRERAEVGTRRAEAGALLVAVTTPGGGKH